jgi:two-component sensor histidine kinase
MRERAKAEAALLESQRLEAEAQLAMETERARTALRQTEQQLEFALNAGRLGSWELDLPNGRLTASDIFYASFGIGPETRLDGFEDLSPRIHPADRGRHREAVRKALEDGTDLDSEYRTFAADDEVRWILIRGRAVYDADGKATRMAGVSLDITERKRAEERQQLLLDELNHRVKNTLATVQSIAIQTAKSVARTGSFENAFIARINALSRAHDLLTEVAWEGATLREVVANTLAPYAGQDQAGRVRFDGPAVRLGPNAAVTLTMAFHELATNAAKYGSLSVASGEVDVAWRFEGAPEAGIVELEWRERGGPPVAIPTRRGFGVRLVETGLAREFGGEVQIRFEPEGLSCRMRLPTSGKLQMAA